MKTTIKTIHIDYLPYKDDGRRKLTELDIKEIIFEYIEKQNYLY